MQQFICSKRLDSSGRLTLPKELRESLSIGENDEIRIYLEEKRIILERAVPIYTDLFDNMVVSEPLYDYHGKKIARSSIIELASLAGLISD